MHTYINFTFSSFSIAILLFFFNTTYFVIPVQAQSPLGIDPALRSGDRRELFFEEDASAPPFTIFPPESSDDALSKDRKISTGPGIGILVREIRTIGNQTFSNADLSEITKPFLNQTLYYEDLERIRRKLTLHYVDSGYVNSGAFLPDQDITGGVVTFAIFEAELTAVDVRGNRWLRECFYRSRIRLDSGPPVNIHDLERRLQMIQQHHLVKRVQAEFKPGFAPGQSVLALNVEERPPFELRATANNYQSPSVGAERGLVSAQWQSVTGLGDTLDFTYGRSEGLDPLLDVGYRLPFTPWETELSARYRKNDFGVVSEAFQVLDIKSESEIIKVMLRQPLWRTPNWEIAVGLAGERLYSKSTLLGIPFSFTPGPIDGESTVAALRFSQEYLYRSRQQVLAAHSRFSRGVNTLDATIHSNGEPDGRFFAWMGQFQYAKMVTPQAVQAIFKTDIQLADQPLLALEQLPIGGRYSVRGYRENQLVRDNGVIASLETRIALVQNARWADTLQLIPFCDYGQGWNTKTQTPEPNTIYSVGMGLRWALTVVRTPFPIKTELEVYWGYPLEKILIKEDDLQDEGIHFQFNISAF